MSVHLVGLALCAAILVITVIEKLSPLHNETSFAIQRRLQWDGITTVILPIRMRI